MERNSLKPSDIDAVELLGGGSRVPRVQVRCCCCCIGWWVVGPDCIHRGLLGASVPVSVLTGVEDYEGHMGQRAAGVAAKFTLRLIGRCGVSAYACG